MALPGGLRASGKGRKPICPAAILQRHDDAEQRAAWGLVAHLQEGDLVILDRGLASAAFSDHCRSRGIDVLMRAQSTWRPNQTKASRMTRWRLLTGRSAP